MAKDQQGPGGEPVGTRKFAGPVPEEMIDEQQREQRLKQRARLIKALSRFKPSDANPLQFYNCVRELCIMHNCSIDEGLERAAITWPGLSQQQRELYDSQRHAELPIPVPKHLVYTAFQKERNGEWALGRAPANNYRSTRYTLEDYKPPPKQSRMRTQLIEQRPKYDNLLDLPPKVAAARVPPPPKPKVSRASPSSFRRIRSPTPPVVRTASMNSLQGKTTRRRKRVCKSRRGLEGKKEGQGEPEPDHEHEHEYEPEPEPEVEAPKEPKRLSKSRRAKAQRKIEREREEQEAAAHNWQMAIGCVRRRLMMHRPSKV
ncbi:hypothetical protein KR018_005567 [Drosophila ironensis]|nr:hypothetical protein KR018_005567 [Drosophila ironensis]